jgi:hypothetical protein
MSAIRSFAKNHPQIAAWVVLAIGMVIILVWSAKDVGFTTSQWTALVVTTILLAGACVWIIGWGDDDDLEEEAAGSESETLETTDEEQSAAPASGAE